MNDDLTSEEIQLARERIKQWPLEERAFLTSLTEDEVRAVLLLVALLDIRPVKGERP